MSPLINHLVTVDASTIDTAQLLLPFIMILQSENNTGPVVDSVLTALEMFFSGGIISSESPEIQRYMGHLLDTVAHCQFEATDKTQDEVVLTHMLELLKTALQLPIGKVMLAKDVWVIFDTVYQNSQEVSRWRGGGGSIT